MEKLVSNNGSYKRPSFFDAESRREYLEDLGRRHERFPYKLSKIAQAGKSYFHWLRKTRQEFEDGKSLYKSDAVEKFVREFVQANAERFDLHSYMEALYDDKIRYYFPELLRYDLEPIKVGRELENRVGFLKTGEFHTLEHVSHVNAKPQHLREFSGKFMNAFRSLHVGNGFRHCSSHINFLEGYEGAHYQDNAYVLDPAQEKEFVESVKSVSYIGIREIPKISQNAENWFFTNGWSQQHPTFILEFENRRPMIAYLSNGIFGQAYEEGELLIAEQK